MAISRHFNLTKDNKHLLDIFSDDCYLELGNISNSVLNKLLKKKLVRYSDLTYFDIQNKGIGSSNIANEELEKKIPFMYFENLYHKKPSRQLFISHGVLVQKRGYKEYFTPIILIPINIFYKDNEIWLHMVDEPIENPYLPNYRKSIDLSNEKFKQASSLDEFCINCFKQEKQNLRFENYLTFGEISLADRLFFNDKFALENVNVNNVYNGFNIEDDNAVCNITTLNKLQRNALEYANNGNSFALTGILGTGKTTTLINIATNAIYNGKKVLYISNNTETLKDVKDLFKAYDLDYLLSDFSNPFDKSVEEKEEFKLDSINDNVIKSELQTKYDGIKEYTKMLYDKINGYAFIDVMKGLIEYKDIKDYFTERDLKGIDNLYRLEIVEVEKALRLIDEQLSKIASYKNSKFNNIPIKNNVSHNEISSLLKDLYLNYDSLSNEKNTLEKDYGFSNIPNYAYFRNIINNYKQLDKDLIPASWLYYDIKDCKTKKLVNFQEAKVVFSKFSEEMAQEKAKEMMLDNEYNVQNIANFNIHYGINLILSRFKNKDIDLINAFLKNNKKLCEKLLKLKETINECEYNFGKMRDKIGIKVNYRDTDTIEQLVPMILYFGSHKIPKLWLDIKNSDGVRKRIINLENHLNEYEMLLPVYNKFFNDINNIDNNLIYLKKKSEKNDKYQNVNIHELIEKISKLRDLHKQYDNMQEDYYALTLHNFDKEYSVIDDFDNFISLVNGIENDNVRNKIIKNLISLKDNALEEFIKPFIIFSTTYLEIKKEYENLKEYDLVRNEVLLPDIINKIYDVCDYCLNIQNIQNKMDDVIKKNLVYVPYQEYILLANKIEDLELIRHKINSNEKYAFLYGKMFKGYETDIEQIDKFLLSFSLYTNIFKDNDSLNASLDSKIDIELGNILDESSKISEKISELLKDYSKIFRDSVGRFYYDNLPSLIIYLDNLINSNQELQVYLKICDGMKVLLKYKLYNFNQCIIENDRMKYADRFMASYYKHLYDKYVEVKPGIANGEGYYRLLKDIMVKEKYIFHNNIEKLKEAREKKFTSANFKNQTYMSYLNKVIDYKYLVLSNTQTVNLHLDIDYFDVVLIDDANLLNAEHYYKALNAKQVIIAGLNDVGVSIAKDIVSKIKKKDIIELKRRYVKTPMELLKNISRASGVFYSDEVDNNGLEFETKDFSDFVCDLLVVKDENGKYIANRNIKINYFVRNLKKERKLFDDICNKLIEYLSLEDIFYIFIKQINICDLYHPYLWNSDYNIIDLEDYANESDIYKINNLISGLMCTKKKLIIIDKEKLLENNKKEGFLKSVDELKNSPSIISPIVDPVASSLAKSFAEHKLKVLGKYNNYDLVVQKKKKNYGVIIFNAPTNYGEDILNIYRDYDCSDFPCSIVFLNDFIENFENVVQEIIEDTKNEN